MTVAQFPDHSALNPYVDLNREALERAGIRVVRHALYPAAAGRAPRLRLAWLWGHRREVRILQLHWYQRLYAGRGRVGTTACFVRFALALLLARALGYRVVWTAHNLLPHESTWTPVDLAARRLLVAVAGAVLVDSEPAAGLVRSACPAVRRLAIAAHGHYADVYPRPPEQATARRELDLPGDDLVFLVFGLIRPYKQVPWLLEVFLERFRSDGCRLLVAGEPVDEAMRRAVVRVAQGRPRVSLILRYVQPDEVAIVFAASNVVVCPYDRSLVSGTAILACSLGRAPIVPTTSAMGLEGHPGSLRYEPGDAGSLAAALAAARDGDWDAMGCAARRAILERSWDAGAAAAAAVYRELAG